MKNFIIKIKEIFQKFFLSSTGCEKFEITNHEVLSIHDTIDAALKIQDISKRICCLIDCKRTLLQWLGRSMDSPVLYNRILKEINRIDRQLDQLLIHYGNQLYYEAKMFHLAQTQSMIEYNNLIEKVNNTDPN